MKYQLIKAFIRGQILPSFLMFFIARHSPYSQISSGGKIMIQKENLSSDYDPTISLLNIYLTEWIHRD